MGKTVIETSMVTKTLIMMKRTMTMMQDEHEERNFTTGIDGDDAGYNSSFEILEALSPIFPPTIHNNIHHYCIGSGIYILHERVNRRHCRSFFYQSTSEILCSG